MKAGQQVEIGDPLVDVYSHELADAKTDYLSKYAQWQHDLALAERYEKLAKDHAIADQLALDAKTTEIKSKLDYEVSLKKLKVYQLTPEDIDKIRNQQDEGIDLAKMTIRSTATGKVVSREVAPGNLYDLNSPPLMVIASLDHLWVWANVFESDINKVHVGQTIRINFPFLHQTIPSKVEYVSNEVNPDTHAVRICATIPNPGDLKSEMLVKARIEIAPIAGQTVVPRVSMVTSSDEKAYIFVRNPKVPNKFSRLEVIPILEKDEFVVLQKGVEPGMEVVTTGSLILAQRFEDEFISKFGMPLTASSTLKPQNPDQSDDPDGLKHARTGKGFDFDKSPL